jgi:iron complex outermembrane recepter protein
MTKVFAFILLTFIFINVLNAQQNTGRVTGALIVEQKNANPDFILQLLSLPDSNIVASQKPDSLGQFTFTQLKEGRYVVIYFNNKVSKKIYSEPFEVVKGNNQIHLKPIVVDDKEVTLHNVNLVPTKLMIEHRPDKTVINVEASVTNAGSNILEVLEKSPGVSVDNEGNILLNGKPDVQIYIDNRPMRFTKAELINILRGMTAEQISQIEIIPNPPAKFEAGGNAGIINLKTKKSTQFGHNGNISLTYGQGKLPKFNMGIIYNYRKGKSNYYINFSKTYARNFRQINSIQKFLVQPGSAEKDYLTQNVWRNRKSESINIRAGADYTPSNRTTIGFVVTGIDAPLISKVSNMFQQFDQSNILQGITESRNNSSNKSLNIGSSVILSHVIDSAKSDITAEINYSLFTVIKNQEVLNTYMDNNGNTIKTGDTISGLIAPDMHIYNVGLDYMKMLNKKLRVDIGVKSSFVAVNNTSYYDSLKNGLPVSGSRRVNDFDYKELISGLYASIFFQKSKKFNIRVGLRAENTSLKSVQQKEVIRISKNYTNLFTSSSLQYSLNEKNKIAFNYSRRIKRPDYNSFNSFAVIADKYNYEQGNSQLKPQFSNNIELLYLYKNSITITGNFTQISDQIQGVLLQNDSTKETVQTYYNTGSFHQYGLAISVNKQWKKWYSGNIFISLYNNSQVSILTSKEIRISQASVLLQATQQFKFKKVWAAELSGNFQTKFLSEIFYIKRIGQLNIGVSRQVLKGRGSIKVNFRDVFYSQVYNIYSNFNGLDIAFSSRADSRIFRISFSYLFGNDKLKTNIQKSGQGITEELKRIKVEDN